MDKTLEHVLNFLTVAAAFAAASVVLFLILYLIERWKGPIEFGELYRRVFGKRRPGGFSLEKSNNVELHGSDDTLLILGPYLSATLRNGRGKVYRLSEGCFVGCDPRFIKIGATCCVTYQDGSLYEELTVQLDDDRDKLFVKSAYRNRREVAEALGKKLKGRATNA